MSFLNCDEIYCGLAEELLLKIEARWKANFCNAVLSAK